jgi:4-hydroxy-4-methyl-2-oxoglutarate aldolase
VNVPIAITGCRIAPGDLVIGDASGVIVVPRASMDDVLAEAERIAARERTQATSAGPP